MPTIDPIAPAPRTHSAWRALLVVGTIVGGLAWVVFQPTASPAPASLDVTAASGPLGVTLTNREARDLTRCDATITDDHQTDWVASWQHGLPARIAPLETVGIEWRAFQHGGQPMPGYIGGTRGLALTCIVEGETLRRSVGLSAR